jgi:replication fork clamp-binding protein CrfC
VIKIKKSIKKKKLEKNNNVVSKINIKKNKSKPKNNAIKTKIVNKTQNNIVDVCTILEKCSIDEISKHLIKEGKSKNFPDITKRQ